MLGRQRVTNASRHPELVSGPHFVKYRPGWFDDEAPLLTGERMYKIVAQYGWVEGAMDTIIGESLNRAEAGF